MKRYATWCLALAIAGQVRPAAAQQKAGMHRVASWTTAQPLIRMPPPAPRRHRSRRSRSRRTRRAGGSGQINESGGSGHQYARVPEPNCPDDGSHEPRGIAHPGEIFQSVRRLRGCGGEGACGAPLDGIRHRSRVRPRAQFDGRPGFTSSRESCCSAIRSISRLRASAISRSPCFSRRRPARLPRITA